MQRAGEKLGDFRPAAEVRLIPRTAPFYQRELRLLCIDRNDTMPCVMQMRVMASKKAVLAAKAELGRLTKENSQLDEARGVAVGRRDAIIQKVQSFIIFV